MGLVPLTRQTCCARRASGLGARASALCHAHSSAPSSAPPHHRRPPQSMLMASNKSTATAASTLHRLPAVLLPYNYIAFAPAGQHIYQIELFGQKCNVGNPFMRFALLPYTRFASTVHGCFGPTVVRKTIKFYEIRGRKTQSSWHSAGPSFLKSQPNRAARTALDSPS